MAKYSRSSLTMKESLAEISSQRAEQFLNTFYFQYGHRSIADLAHIPFAIERLSLLAAIDLVDEQRWDGQERSTRYQNFRRSGWYTPDLGAETPAFTAAVEALFTAYDHVSAGMLEALKGAIPRPEAMKPDAYERTLKARAFDVARYLLPLATNTSLGQIVNARTLETQVSRLLTSPFAEVRQLGEKLRIAATEPAWNVQHSAAQVLCEEIGSVDRNLRRTCDRGAAASGKDRADAGEVRNAERLSAPVAMRTDRGCRGVDGRPGDRAGACRRSARRRRVARGRTGDIAALSALPLLVPSASQQRCGAECRPLRRADRAGNEAPRTPRRAAARLQRRSQSPLRHPDGHRRLPRYASSPPLCAASAGLHRRSRLRGAGLPRPANPGRSRA